MNYFKEIYSQTKVNQKIQKQIYQICISDIAKSLSNSKITQMNINQESEQKNDLFIIRGSQMTEDTLIEEQTQIKDELKKQRKCFSEQSTKSFISLKNTGKIYKNITLNSNQKNQFIIKKRRSRSFSFRDSKYNVNERSQQEDTNLNLIQFQCFEQKNSFAINKFSQLIDDILSNFDNENENRKQKLSDLAKSCYSDNLQNQVSKQIENQ